jgi:hypothetical protein
MILEYPGDGSVHHREMGEDWTEKINFKISRIVICCTLIYNFCGDSEFF